MHHAGLRLRWNGHVRAASFHGSLSVLEALRRVPASVQRVEAGAETQALAESCEALSTLYREAAAQVEEMGYASLDSQVVHGDFHPGNVLFEGDRVAGVIDEARHAEGLAVDFSGTHSQPDDAKAALPEVIFGSAAMAEEVARVKKRVDPGNRFRFHPYAKFLRS